MPAHFHPSLRNPSPEKSYPAPELNFLREPVLPAPRLFHFVLQRIWLNAQYINSLSPEWNFVYINTDMPVWNM